MILTNCAACAAPLAHNAPRCVRCHTRYCNKTCQHDHWRRGHKQICKRIHRGGNAEQYHADKKYKEAVAEAVEACADDTKGQTCFICTQALHWKTKEGLVRGCACRGTAGFAHVSCLAEQAKILVAEGEENNLGNKAKNERWDRWHKCSQCKQMYHGVVMCALGWACWKMYVGRPETDWRRSDAMKILGNGLFYADRHEEALSVQETELAMRRRFGLPEECLLLTQSNLATTYTKLGQAEQGLRMRRETYDMAVRVFGEANNLGLLEANNLAGNLVRLQHFEEAKELLRKTMPVARRVLGASHDTTIMMRMNYAEALFGDDGATLNDLREAVTTLEDLERTARRVLGDAHPLTTGIREDFCDALATLHAREKPSPAGNA